MVKISQPVTAEWVSANERAAAQRQAGRTVARVAPGTYQCPSSKGDGTVYTQRIVNVGQLQATCDCPHGQHGTAGHCWHLAAAISAEVRRVSRPKPAPAPSATPERRAEVAGLMARAFRA